MLNLYPKGYTGPILNPKANMQDDLDRLAWYKWAIRPSTTSIPKYTRPDTKHWTELNLKAFIYSLMP
jgi:hypothetical protein